MNTVEIRLSKEGANLRAKRLVEIVQLELLREGVKLSDEVLNTIREKIAGSIERLNFALTD